MSDGRRVEELAPQDELKFRTIMEAALDAIVVADMSGNIISWNPGAEVIFGYVEAEVLGRPLTILMPERHRAAHLRGLDRLRTTGERQRIGRTSELQAVRKDGQEFPIEISLGTWVTEGARFFCGIIRDVSERKQLEEALRHAAMHDGLSHLPNRVYFNEQLNRAGAHAGRQDALTCLMLVDLDDFKRVNDRFGHQVGDQVLVSAATRLKSCVRAGDCLARFGGDEFVVLMEDLKSAGDAEAAAGRIFSGMQEPLSVAEREVQVSVSVGAAVKRGGFVPEDLLRQADRALYRAKARGKATHEVAAE